MPTCSEVDACPPHALGRLMPTASRPPAQLPDAPPPHQCEQHVGSAAPVSLDMPQNAEAAFRQVQTNFVQQPVLQAGRGTEADIVAPSAASAAERTASFDDSASATRSLAKAIPNPCKAASTIARVS